MMTWISRQEPATQAQASDEPPEKPIRNTLIVSPQSWGTMTWLF